MAALLAALALVTACTPAAAPRAEPGRARVSGSAPPRKGADAQPLPQGAALRKVSATKGGVSIAGRAVCAAEATLVSGYSEGCAPGRTSVAQLEEALRERTEGSLATSPEPEPAWLLEVDMALPLVALSQIVTSFYRAPVSDFTLASGGKRRSVTNRRSDSILVVHLRADHSFRADVEQGSFALGPSCPRTFVALSRALESCVREVERIGLSILIDMGALPSVPGETRTVAFLWSVIEQIDRDVPLALR